MGTDSLIPLKDQKGKQSFFAEVVNTEKQLWALIHSKGLLHSETQALYQKVRSSYVKIILNEQETEQPQDIEYSLWKLHYKHIDEFRKRIRQSSANGESKKSTMPQNVANTQNSNDKYLEGFKLFLLEATEFYQDLIKKIRRCNGLPEEPLFYRKSGIYGSVLPTKMHDCQFSCHRFFVCLGDLARYRERYEKPDVQSRNWSVAATYYLEATMIWPDSGNPQNQLAVLATYVGDEFLALYHCVRSLAVKEPFPDAWKNLIVLFEENRLSNLQSLSKEAHFDFLKPSKSFEMIQSQLSDGSSNCSISSSTEEVHSVETDLWSLIIRMISFFFIKSSLEDFPSTFASTMKELKRLMALDNTKLKATLESYQRTDAGRTGPFRAIQVVSVLIFIIENLTNSPEQKDPKTKNDMQQPALTQLALAATFICMGCFTDRCLTGNPVNDCPILPAVLVFVEWLVAVLDKEEIFGADEKSESAISYFFGAFVELLNQLDDKRGNVESPDSTALWEDYELRGFAPVVHAHESLDFGAHWGNLNSYESRNECRGQRITHAAIKIANGSSDSRKWIIYDEVERKFYTAESKKSPNSRGSELVEPCSAVEVELPCQPICEINKECEQQILGENQSSPQVHSKSVAVEEEEVILFKPITRYNSAPVCTSSTENDLMFPEDIGDQAEPSDECLRRASSLLIAQNEAYGDPLTSTSTITNFRSKKSFEPLEALIKESVVCPFSEGPVFARPPSLSSWVLNRGSLSTEREKGTSNFNKHGLEPVEETVEETLSASFIGLSMDETKNSVTASEHVSPTLHYSSPPYIAPMPSAPLLPDDAVWFSGVPSSFPECKSPGVINETGAFMGASPLSGYSNWTATHGPVDYTPSIPGLIYGHSPLLGARSSPEWFHHYNYNQNFEQANIHMRPVQFSAAGNLGDFHGYDASRFDLFDRWGNPLASNPLIYLESPPLHPGSTLVYGADEQRREKLFHGYQRPFPYGYGAATDLRDEQQQLLQYLKEKELRLPQDPQVRGPTYMGN